MLKITFEGSGDNGVFLPLKVALANSARVQPTSRVRTITVNQNQKAGLIANIPITTNPELGLDNWVIREVRRGNTIVTSDVLEVIEGLGSAGNMMLSLRN
jgi:hypothetical protein